jgi:hypothetical protein
VEYDEDFRPGETGDFCSVSVNSFSTMLASQQREQTSKSELTLM